MLNSSALLSNARRTAATAACLVALALPLTLTSCSDPLIGVTVKNGSPMKISDVQINGGEGAWELELPDIDPSESITVHPDFEGESALHLEFTARGKRHTGVDMGPLDATKKTELRISVGDDLSIRRR